MMRRILYILCLALLVTEGAVLAQDTRSQESRKARLQKEIRQINDCLKDNKSKSRSEMSNLSLLKKKIANRTELIAENEHEIALITDSIRTASGEIKALTAQLDTLTAGFNRMVGTAYKNRDAKVWFLYILGSRNIRQGVRRFSYLKNISRDMGANARRIQETRQALEGEKARLDSLNGRARERKRAIEGEVSALGKEKAQSEQMIARLQKDKSNYMAQLQKKNKEVEALNREIAAIIRKAAAAKAPASPKPSGSPSGGTAKPGTGSGKTPAPATGKAVSTDADPALSGQFEANKGRLPWPVNGAVLESFGQHYHPVYTNVKLPYNNGVTVSTQAGAPVKAVYDGVVTQIIVMPGYNQCILVQHGKYFTFYCCLTGATVKKGDKVKTGQTLGSVCTIDGEARMHFELWQDRTPQNPESWLK